MIASEKLREAFELAAKWVKDHHAGSSVSNSVMFRLYGLYKRSTVGACNVRQPTLLVEPIARERYNAWKLASVMSEEQAMREYLDLARISFPTFEKTYASLLRSLEDMNSIRDENTALLQETSQMLTKISRLQKASITKRGHLYKCREVIGFGGSKWRRHFLTLQGTNLSVYQTQASASPLRVISLRGCVVGTEPPKKDGKYHVFALYPSERVSPRVRGMWVDDGPELEDGGVVIRLSTQSGADCREWVDALNQACLLAAVQLEPRVISEMNAAVNEEIAVAAARADGKEEDPETRRLRLRRQVSENRALVAVVDKVAEQKVETRAHKLDPLIFPPSMAMHKQVRPSVLSNDYPSRDYTGYLNLAMIVLGVHFFHAMVDLVSTVFEWGIQLPQHSLVEVPCLMWGLALYGFIALAVLIEKWAAYGIPFLSSPPPADSLIAVLHTINCLVTLIIPCIVAWSKPEVPLHTFLLLFWATVSFLKLVSFSHTNWDLRQAYFARGGKSLRDYDNNKSNNKKNSKDFDDNAKPRHLSIGSGGSGGSSKGPTTAAGSAEPVMVTCVEYPQSVSFGTMGYFIVAPTLCYQPSYPRSERIRLRTILSILFRILAMTAFAGFLIDQKITPIIKKTMVHVDSLHILKAFSHLLELAIPSTGVWLIMFYVYFHLFLNLFGELTRFGDRCFYKDWWNCTSFSRYWRSWNMPVHSFVVRHVYFPCLRAGYSKMAANIAVFAVSAFFHELLISIPCHVVRMWAFLAMMGQIPLIYITDKLEKTLFKETQAGNFVFWVIFCVLGQPMAALLYYYDFHSRQQLAAAAGAAIVGGV